MSAESRRAAASARSRLAPAAGRASARRIRSCIDWMLEVYGPQGWWPVRSEGSPPNDSGDPRWSRGYHPGRFDYPKTREGRWEIAAGAVLTQNTAWRNVEQALLNLRAAGICTPDEASRCKPDELATLIRPAGYYNQKARYLLAAAEWFSQHDDTLAGADRDASVLARARPTLLAVRGVGHETADSVLLYAFSLPTFVIDAYTRRIFERLGAIEPGAHYEVLRSTFQDALASAGDELNVRRWQEAHAVIVEHAKRHHGPGSDGSRDPLRGIRAGRRSAP